MVLFLLIRAKRRNYPSFLVNVIELIFFLMLLFTNVFHVISSFAYIKMEFFQCHIRFVINAIIAYSAYSLINEIKKKKYTFVVHSMILLFLGTVLIIAGNDFDKFTICLLANYSTNVVMSLLVLAVDLNMPALAKLEYLWYFFFLLRIIYIFPICSNELYEMMRSPYSASTKHASIVLLIFIIIPLWALHFVWGYRIIKMIQ